MNQRRLIEILSRLLAISGAVAVILSLTPFMQYRGGILGALVFAASLFVLKRLREENNDETYIQKALSRSVWALFFGILVTSSCNFYSYLFYNRPLIEDEIRPIKEEINEEIRKNREAIKLKNAQNESASAAEGADDDDDDDD